MRSRSNPGTANRAKTWVITGEVHQIGYISNGLMILVDFVNRVSQREGFANPDTFALTPEAVERILIMSAVEGTKWQETNAPGGDRSWKRSDNKVVAIFPAQGKFLFVQDVNFVQPKVKRKRKT
jgi:hypothetical protein